MKRLTLTLALTLGMVLPATGEITYEDLVRVDREYQPKYSRMQAKKEEIIRKEEQLVSLNSNCYLYWQSNLGAKTRSEALQSDWNYNALSALTRMCANVQEMYLDARIAILDSHIEQRIHLLDNLEGLINE